MRALFRRGVVAPRGGQPFVEEEIGPVSERRVQRRHVHHTAAHARTDAMDRAGSDEPAGRAVAEVPDMVAERDGEVLALLDEIQDEGDKEGDGVKGCGNAGPSPR